MKKITASKLTIVLDFALAGCASPEMLAAKAAAEQREDENTCLSEGFKLGTDTYKLCLLTLKQGRANGAAIAAARSEANYWGMQAK